MLSNLRTRSETYVYKITQFDWLTAFQNSFSRKQPWLVRDTKRDNIYSATKLWNTEIPIQLQQSTSLKAFKKSYKYSLISSIWCCTFPSCIIEFHIPRFTYLNWKKHLRHTLFIYIFAAFWLVKWLSRSFEKVRLHLRLALGICNTYPMFTNSWLILYYNGFKQENGLSASFAGVSQKRNTGWSGSDSPWWISPALSLEYYICYIHCKKWLL